MMFARAESGSFAVVPRNDSAQTLSLFDLAFIGRREVGAKNLVPNIHTLMRSLIMVVRQPLVVDVIKLPQAYAVKMVQAFPFNLSDVALAIPIRLESAYRCFMDFRTFALPDSIESCRKFGVTIPNQPTRFNSEILKPHGGISSLLKHPFFLGIKRGWTHENPPTSEMDKHQDIGINPSSPRKDGFAVKIGRDQRFHVGADKQFPVARGMSAALFGDRMMARPFKDVTDRCQADLDAQLLKLSMQVFVAPDEVVGSKLKDEIYRCLWRSWTAWLATFRIFHIQPASISPWLDDKHYVGDIVLKHSSKPHQVGSLFFGRNNLGIINAISQHIDLIRQQLEPGIVSRHEKPREKNKNHMKHTRKTIHFRLNPIGLILLFIKGLRGDLRFRTPRKIKEL